MTKMERLPIYKERLPLNGIGKQGGGRIIYLCDASSLVALSIYTKNDKEPVASEIVSRALTAIEIENETEDVAQ